MSVNPQDSSPEVVSNEQPKNDKEYNFAQLRKQAEQLAKDNADLKAKLAQSVQKPDDEDSYDEPYIDKRYFKKQMSQGMQQIQEEADRRAEQKMRTILVEEKRNAWMKNNPDFSEVMQHAQKLADTDPELADTILEMPEGFERQKLVYKNIKALGLHKPAEPKQSVQDTIDKNRKGAFYQPSNTGSAPYGNRGDFSDAGKKTAFDQMKALQSRMRLG